MAREIDPQTLALVNAIVEGQQPQAPQVAENITEDWLLKRHEKLMQQLLGLDGPNDPRAQDLSTRSKNNNKWYTRVYNRNRDIPIDDIY